MIELISSLSDRTRRWSTVHQRELFSVAVGVWHLPICLTGQVQGLNNSTAKRQSNHQRPGCHLWFYILAFSETFHHHHNKLDNSFIPRQKLCRSAVQNKQLASWQLLSHKIHKAKHNQTRKTKSTIRSRFVSLRCSAYHKCWQTQMHTNANALNY